MGASSPPLTTIAPDHPARQLIRALQQPDRYPHATGTVQLIETHISWVLLAGDYVYKIKKPVDLGYVDFSTLAQRERCCREEIRLNSRLAPGIYLDSVAIRGTPEKPRFDGAGAAIEYAVRMRRFPDEALASRMLAAGNLTPGQVAQLAGKVADFHGEAPAADRATPYGEPHLILRSTLESITPLLAHCPLEADRRKLQTLWHWSEHQFERLRDTFIERKRAGRVRECHGDLHLANIALLDGEMGAFDGIDFNEELRWIDVMSEVAFPVMDLTAHGRADLAGVFLNAYLERGGDYEGLAVLRFYEAYRALVRAKIELLRSGNDLRAGQARRYLELAEHVSQPRRPALVILHGPSGSGKTTVAAQLAQSLLAIHLRSDVERKRLAGLPALARSGSAPGAGLYDPRATQSTYERLARLARVALEGGYSVVVDAAFLQQRQRGMMRAIAEERRAPFALVSLMADAGTLRERLARRAAAGTDASEADAAVLERQLRTMEPLSESEQLSTLSIDTGLPMAGPKWEACLRDLAARLQ